MTDSNGSVNAAEAPKLDLFAQPRVVDPVPIVLDRERHMVMNLKAMKLIKDATGLIMWETSAWDIKDPEQLAYILWGALIHEDPTLTVEDVMSMPQVNIANIMYISLKLGELWGRTMPDAEPGQASEADPKASSPSSTSGQSVDSTSVSKKQSSGT